MNNGFDATTQAATTGPASGPRPTSSTPADEGKALLARGRFELMHAVQAPALAFVRVLVFTLLWVHRPLRTSSARTFLR